MAVGLVATVLLALHLLAMNIVAAAPLVAVWLDRRAIQGDTEAQAAVRRLLNVCCVMIPVGAVLGLALGSLYWNEAYRDVLERFGYRVRWGLIEFLFSAAVIAVYTAWIWRRPRVGRVVWICRSILALLTATNLFYHFPPLFSMIAGVASGDVSIGSQVDSGTFRRLLMDGEVLALSLHFAIASFAVTGIVLAVLVRPAAGSPPANKIAIWGGRLALVSTLCQVPAGIWLMMQLPPRDQRLLLGEDLVAAALFIVALTITFWLLHLFAAIAFGDTSRSTIGRATGAMFLVVLLMTGTLQRAQRHVTSDKPRVQQRISERNAKWLFSALPSPTPRPERLLKSL